MKPKPREQVSGLSVAKIRHLQKHREDLSSLDDAAWIELMNFAKLGFVVSEGIASIVQSEIDELANGVKFGDIDGTSPNS